MKQNTGNYKNGIKIYETLCSHQKINPLSGFMVRVQGKRGTIKMTIKD